MRLRRIAFWASLTTLTMLVSAFVWLITADLGLFKPQVEDLVNNVSEAKSKDFVTESILATGTLHGKTWLGFNWIQYEDLTYDPSNATHRECLAFYGPHICFGDGQRRTDIRVRYDLSDALEIRTRTRLGACRKQNSSVIVNCVES